MKRFVSTLCGLLLGVLLLAGHSQAEASTIVINGSTTMLPFVQAAAESFMNLHKDIALSVSGGGSGNGIKGLIDGTTQIADASRRIQEGEIRMAHEKGIEPYEIVVAVDCVVPIVHPSNPVANLTADQLKAIYTGKITNWKEVGGLDKPIVVITRDNSSGTFEVWGEKILNKEPVTPRAMVVASSGAMVQAVSTNPMAIGYDSLGYVNRSVKALKINGVPGTIETARKGKILTSRNLYMYTNGKPKGDIKKFVDFMLSPKGQAFVKKEGFIPLH